MIEQQQGRSGGFTLVEMSVVLIIVAAVTAMALSSGVAVLSTARFSATTQKMAAIDQALMAYRNANNRLPCPGGFSILAGATNYGVEAGGGMSCGTGTGVGSGVCTGNLPYAVGTCASGTALVPAATNSAAGVTNTGNTGAEGSVPTATLGLSNDFMFDGWGNKFRYAVDVGATASNYFSTVAMGCAVGAINVYDATGSTTRSTSSIYALISHGPNGHGAFSNSTSLKNGGSSNANELTNCHCTTGTGTVTAGTYAPTYVQADPTNSTAGNASTAFDDIVAYKERWQMQNGTDPAGSSCSRIGEIAETDYNGNRVQIFDKNGNYLFAVGAGYNGVSGTQGSAGTGNGQLSNPIHVAFDSSGNLWVTDVGTQRIQEYTSTGAWLGSLGGNTSACTSCFCTGPSACPTGGGTGNGQLDTGGDAFAFDASGNIWFTNSNSNRIVEYNSSGTFQQVLSLAWSSGNGGSQQLGPIAFDKSGDMWISDWYNYRIEELTTSGSWIKTIGGGAACSSCTSTSSCTCVAGTTPGYFYRPNALVFDSSGNLWVADDYQGGSYVTDYIDEFNASTGAYMQQLGGHNTSGAAGKFYNLADLAFDASGNIWAVDGWNNRFEKLTTSGSFISQFPCSSGVCSYSTTNGQFDAPGGVSISR